MPTNAILTERQRIFVDLLPSFNWDIYQAGVEAGYKESYARTHLSGISKTNISVSQAIDAKRVEYTQKAAAAGLTVARIREKHEQAMEMCMVDATTCRDMVNYSRNLEDLGKTIGSYIDRSQRINIDVPVAPESPQERRVWLKEQLALLDAADAAGTALA